MRVDPDYVMLAASIASAAVIGMMLAGDVSGVVAENAILAQLAVFAACGFLTKRPTLKAFHGIGVGEMGLGYVGFKIAPEEVGSLRFCAFCGQAPLDPISVAVTAAYVVMVFGQAILVIKSVMKP